MSAEKIDIAGIRTDYRMAALDENAVGTNPLSFFSKWFQDALGAHITEANAMALATVDAEGKPHARIVLLKGLENSGFVFFTNYHSHKGHEIAANAQVALTFFWKELERQVRIEGTVQKLSEKDSDTYFHSRPEGSRLGAWASPQSEEITDRKILDANYQSFKQQFGTAIPRPPHWGGYTVSPQSVEFWQGRSSRMHDRILFQLSPNGSWSKSRLAP